MASTQRLVQMLGLELPTSFLYSNPSILWRALNVQYRCWDQNFLETFCISYGEHSTSTIDAGVRTPQLEALCILWRALNLSIQYRCWGQNSLEALSVYLMASTQPLVQILGLKLRRRFLYRTAQKLSAYLMASTQPEVQMLGLELPRSAFCICYGEHSTSSIDAGIITPQLEALSVYLMASTEPLVQMLGLELPRSFLYILWRALNVQYRCWDYNSLARSAFCISYGEHSTSNIDAGIRTSQKLSVYLMASTQRLVQMLGLELPSQKLSGSYGEHSTSSIDAGVRSPQKRFLYILWRALNLQYRCWAWNSLARSSLYLMAST